VPGTPPLLATTAATVYLHSQLLSSFKVILRPLLPEITTLQAHTSTRF